MQKKWAVQILKTNEKKNHYHETLNPKCLQKIDEMVTYE
jgi:hypothetical protein